MKHVWSSHSTCAVRPFRWMRTVLSRQFLQLFLFLPLLRTRTFSLRTSTTSTSVLS